jgi:hypothetical protein
MGMADDIAGLSARTVAALIESHDYYTHTKRIWRLVQQTAKEGRRFSIRNLTTGTTVNEKAIGKLAQRYVTDYLAGATFQHFVALFEDFFFDLLRVWLSSYPGSLSNRQVSFDTVLKAVDKGAIVQEVVEKELNELRYKRPTEWFAYLEKVVNLGCPTPDEIERLAEIKATRDVLAHNRGIANATYVSKAVRLARAKAGEKLEIPEPYHRESWELLSKLVRDLGAAASKRATKRSF